VSDRANVDRSLAGDDLWRKRRDFSCVKSFKSLLSQVSLLHYSFKLLLNDAFLSLVSELEFTAFRLRGC
jgi:hypothetical protein